MSDIEHARVLKVIIDCDPGNDDAIAILMALSAPQALDVLGITTVAGNSSVEFTWENAQIICALAGRSDIPVRRGCRRPLVLKLDDATAFHGESGMGGMPGRSELADRLPPVAAQHAVDFLIETIGASPEPVTLVCLAPLTNIALALIKAPEIAGNIREVVFMGGARRVSGNVSPCATFNVMCDPHAAHVVLESGCPVTMIGLDATGKVVITGEVLDEIGAMKSEVGRTAHHILTYFNRRRIEVCGYAPDQTTLNDPCVIAFLLNRQLFTGTLANVAISLDAQLTLGMTVIDLKGRSGRPNNATWVDDTDAQGVIRLLIDSLARYENVNPGG